MSDSFGYGFLCGGIIGYVFSLFVSIVHELHANTKRKKPRKTPVHRKSWHCVRCCDELTYDQKMNSHGCCPLCGFTVDGTVCETYHGASPSEDGVASHSSTESGGRQ